MTTRSQQEIKEELKRLEAPIDEDASDLAPIGALIDGLIASDPEFAESVRAGQAESVDEERRYVMTLASVRKALGLTQGEVAKRLNVTQANVSQIEAPTDMLASTLAGYLGAMGLHVRLLVDIPGEGQVELSIESLTETS